MTVKCRATAGRSPQPAVLPATEEVSDLAQNRRGHQQRAVGIPQQAEARLADVILNVVRSQQDAGTAQQHLSGRFRDEDLFRASGQFRIGLR
jgi:hypothetical protein